MAKTLDQFLEGYLKVKNPDEQKFVNKHVVAKHSDRNGNGDEVFNGSKVKPIDRRKERHGYNPGEDEKVYEETLEEATYEFDVSGEHGNAAVDKLVRHANSKGINAKVHTYNGPGGGNPVIHLSHKDPKAVHAYVKKHLDPDVDLKHHKINEELKGNQHKLDANKNGKVDAHDFELLRKKKKMKEEAEQMDEGNTSWLDTEDKNAHKRTPAEHAKRHKELVADVKKLKSSGVSDAVVAYANNRQQAYKNKYMKEESEQIDEISRKTLSVYTKKAAGQAAGLAAATAAQASSSVGKANPADKRKLRNRLAGVSKAVDKMVAKEEVEDLEEKINMDKASMGDVITDFKKSNAPQFKGKSEEKRRQMAIAAKLSAERGGKKLGEETEELEEAGYSAKAARAGKDIGKPGKQFAKIASAAAEKYGSKERGAKVAGAILKKLRKEEALAELIADLSESHKRTLMTVFEKLNEDNQKKFISACETQEGVEQMLDFAINHRGE